MANTWNQSGTTWGTGRWGTTEALTSGWGVDAWNTGGSWGQATDEVVQVTGLSATASTSIENVFKLLVNNRPSSCSCVMKIEAL